MGKWRSEWVHKCIDSQTGGWMYGTLIVHHYTCAAIQPYLGDHFGDQNPDLGFSSDLP